MAYLKINDNDYSNIVNALNVNTNVNYNAQTNAAGNTVVDYINSKRKIDVGFIALDNSKMKSLLVDLNKFNVSLSFLNPSTNALETINCIIPSSGIEYYTIQVGKVLYNAFTIEFIEL